MSLEAKCYSFDWKVSDKLAKYMDRVENELDSIETVHEYHIAKASIVYSILIRDEGLTEKNLLDRIGRLTRFIPAQLMTETRAPIISHLRFVAIKFYKDKFGKSYPEIARLLEKKNHTTCMSGYERITKALVDYADLIKKAMKDPEASAKGIVEYGSTVKATSS